MDSIISTIVEYFPPTGTRPAAVLLTHDAEPEAAKRHYFVPAALPPGLGIESLNIGNHYAIHNMLDDSPTQINTLRVNENAIIIRKEAATTPGGPSHALLTGSLMSSADDSYNIANFATVTKDGMQAGNTAIGPKGAVVEQVGPKTGRTYGGVMQENPLNFLPSFAFLPLPKYLPSMTIFSTVAGIATLIKDTMKVIQDTTK